MVLYEEGKLLLDDPVSRYIPEFAKPVVLDKFNAEDSSFTTTPAKSEVTIRQLLTHTSGIGYAQIGTRESNAIYAKANITSGIGTEGGHSLATDMKKLGKLPLLHQPGEKWTYGLNTDLLGYLVEVVSGMSLNQFFFWVNPISCGKRSSPFKCADLCRNNTTSFFRRDTKAQTEFIIPETYITNLVHRHHPN